MLIFKIFIIVVIVLIALFLLSLIIYFFNLDMKFSAWFTPIMRKHYDRVKRDRMV